jgi:hypothetical protein
MMGPGMIEFQLVPCLDAKYSKGTVLGLWNVDQIVARSSKGAHDIP